MTRERRWIGVLAVVVAAALPASAQGVRVKLPAWSEPVLLD